MKNIIRRSSQDKKWKEVKEIVATRDKNVCRVLRCCTALEAIWLKKKAGSSLYILDPAHYKPVSQYPELCYDPNNICMINHYSHSLLDDFKDPVFGKPISKEEAEKWWQRILKTNYTQYKNIIEKLKGENENEK